MPGNFSITTRASGSILTAAFYNADRQLFVDYATPDGMDDASATVGAMQAMADPGEVGSESLATDLRGEIQRIRKLLAEITGRTYWYESPASTLAGGVGADIASAATLTVPASPNRSANVTGTVTVTAISTTGAVTGQRVTYRFASALNLIHSATLLLPYGKIYRTVANEVITFVYWGSSVWQMEAASGPSDCVGTGHDFWGETAPDGYLFADNTERNATTFEGLFSELLVNLDDIGRGTGVGTFTADAGTDTITLASHGLVAGAVVHVANAGGALPTGLSTLMKYYVIAPTTNTFQLSLTRSGSAIDITAAGSGTHTCYAQFVPIDVRGRVPLPKDNMGGSSANRVTATQADNIGQGAGAETVTLDLTMIPAHDHGIAGKFAFDAGGSAPTIGGGGSVAASVTAAASAGGGAAHANMPPYLTCHYIVRI